MLRVAEDSVPTVEANGRVVGMAHGPAPNDNPEEVHGRFVDAADEVYHPLEDALLEGRPIRDICEILQTVFLASQIAQSEGKVF